MLQCHRIILNFHFQQWPLLLQFINNTHGVLQFVDFLVYVLLQVLVFLCKQLNGKKLWEHFPRSWFFIAQTLKRLFKSSLSSVTDCKFRCSVWHCLRVVSYTCSTDAIFTFNSRVLSLSSEIWLDFVWRSSVRTVKFTWKKSTSLVLLGL